ncbi:MAG: hypothetical protein GC193_06675 [Cryomorphaceae bacterium]|nr:hypothetical protein [Cryomorphaceae bacterium]
MKYSAFLITAITLLISLTGCLREDSENVNQDRIHTSYELFYNGEEDVTYARATFRFGLITGTKLQLTEPSEVRFNGTPLTFKSGQALYEEDYAGLVNSGTFEFEDLNGNVYVNDVSLTSVSFPDTWGPLSHSSPYELFWNGPALTSNETMGVTINNAAGGTSNAFLEDANSAISIGLSTEQISGLGLGTTSAFLERTKNPSLQEATNAGGDITARYRTGNSGIEITE